MKLICFEIKAKTQHITNYIDDEFEPSRLDELELKDHLFLAFTIQ